MRASNEHDVAAVGCVVPNAQLRWRAREQNLVTESMLDFSMEDGGNISTTLAASYLFTGDSRNGVSDARQRSRDTDGLDTREPEHSSVYRGWQPADQRPTGLEPILGDLTVKLPCYNAGDPFLRAMTAVARRQQYRLHRQLPGNDSQLDGHIGLIQPEGRSDHAGRNH